MPLLTLKNNGTDYSISGGVITVSGLIDELELEQVAYIYNFTTNRLLHAHTLNMRDSGMEVVYTAITNSATITLTGDRQPEDTDILHIQIHVDTLGYNAIYPLKVAVYDPLGNRLDDNNVAALKTITYDHHEVHDGNHYFYSDCLDPLGSGSVQNYVINVPDSDVAPHFTFIVTGSLSTNIGIYEGGDRTGTTAQTPRNNNRRSGNASVISLFKGLSGGTTDGTNLHPDCFGSGTAGGSGGAAKRSEEIILARNTQYIIRVTSNTNGNRISVHFDWYEHISKSL